MWNIQVSGCQLANCGVKAPAQAFPGEAAIHMEIVQEIERIVQHHKIEGDHGRKEERRAQAQGQANQQRPKFLFSDHHLFFMIGLAGAIDFQQFEVPGGEGPFCAGRPPNHAPAAPKRWPGQSFPGFGVCGRKSTPSIKGS